MYEIPSQAVTHAGRFHADDVFSTALLRILNPQIQVQRVFQVPEGFSGLAFDIGWGVFDHHQQGAPVRENGVPYAAFGLLWRAFGPRLLEEREARWFDEQFVQPLDLDDNTGCGHPLADAIGTFNPSWDSDETADSCFWRAVAVAQEILDRRLESVRSIQRARTVVEQALANCQDRIVVLERFAPWKGVLAPSPALYVVYPSQRGGYSAQAVPKEESTELKCPFPQAWAGLPTEQLRSCSGLKTLRFCHKNQFLIAADSLEDAVAACRLSIREAGL